MKTYTVDELKVILERHRLWVNNDLKGQRINLFEANLSEANLSGANLFGADLFEANLFGVNLSGAALSEANLSGANLSGANLSGANLSRANLSGATLSEANLSRANLSRANLSGADMSMFNIISNGNIEVYKKLRNGYIATLEIKKGTRRVNAYGSRKCRAEKAKVISIEDENGKSVNIGYGLHDENFVYKVGKIITPDSFNDDPRIECSNGVHFFITKEEARNYNG